MLRNVIIVNDSDFICGGEDKVAIQTANVLAEKYPYVNIVFFSCNSRGKSSELNPKVTQISTNQGNALEQKNKIKGIINGICNFKFRKEFKKLLLSCNYQDTIVHVHSWSKAVTSEVFDLCNKLNFKCILTMHDYFIGCPNGRIL